MANLGLLADATWLAGAAFIASAIAYTGGYVPEHLVGATSIGFAGVSAVYIHQVRQAR